MQISLAMRMASIARSFAVSFECFSRARAAASAYVPPDPIATSPSSGSITSPVPGKNECALGIRYDQQRFQVAKRAVLAPFLSQLDRGFLQIARKLLKFPFEPLKKRNRIGRRASKTSYDLVVVKTAGLSRRVLHHVVAHGHLAIGDQHHSVVLAHA